MTGDIKQGPKGQASLQEVGDMPLQKILFFVIKQYNTYSTYLQREILKLLTIPCSTYNTKLTLLTEIIGCKNTMSCMIS